MPGLASFEASRGWRFAAIVALGLIAIIVAARFQAPDDIDFISYWAAAKLTLSGHAAAAYDLAAHRAVEASAVPVEGKMPFASPPPVLLVLWPFGLLPFAWATMAWVVAGLSLYVWTVRRTLPGMLPLALAFPPLLVSGIVGQTGWITASLFIGAMALLPKRPLVAGLVFGCLAMKPQLAILVPLALLAGREWRAIAGAALSVSALALLTLIVFGAEVWQGFFAMLPLFGAAASEGTVGWSRIASLYAALRMIGMPETLAMSLHAIVAMIAAFCVWRVWSRPAEASKRAAILAAATMLISPYLYLYDHLMLIAAVAWAVHAGVPQRWVVLLYLVSLGGLIQMIVPAPPANIMPLTPLVLVAIIMFWQPNSSKRHQTPISSD